jgi:hypothetical protein
MAITIDVTSKNTTISPTEGVTTTLDITTSIPTISSFRPLINAINAGGDGSLTYNSNDGNFTYTGPSATEARAHFSAGTGVSYSNGQFSIGQDVATNATPTFISTTVAQSNLVNGAAPYLNFYNTKNQASSPTALTVDSDEVTGVIPFYGIAIDTDNSNAEAYRPSARIFTKFTDCRESALTGQMVFEVTKAGATHWSINNANPKNVMVIDPGTVTIGVTGYNNALDLTDLVVHGSLDINGNADISGNLTGIDTLTATNLVGTLATANRNEIFSNVSGDITIAAGGGATIQATSVENSMLAGSITNAKLSNSTITVSDGSNTSPVALGGTLTFAGTSNEVTVAENAGTVTIGLPDDVTIAGDLSVATAPTAGAHVTNKTYVDAKVAALVDSAPEALDTLKELATALGDDANYATTTASSIGEKLAKASNLSDLTNAGTARTNLGLGTAATTDATAYATAAQGTKADNALVASTVSAYGATIIDDANAGAARTTLGLGTAATTDATAYLASDGTASTVTVADSTANTDFPVVFHDESNGLLDDTGALTYNPSTGALVSSGTISAYVSTAEAAQLRAGREDGQDISIFCSDAINSIVADQDTDLSSDQQFVLNRTFNGNVDQSSNNSYFKIQNNGSTELEIKGGWNDNSVSETTLNTTLTTGATTVNGALTVNSDLLKVVSTAAGAAENPILSLYRNKSPIALTDEIGAIEFSGNGADGAEHIYSRIYSELSVITEGAEQANLRFALSRNNGMEDPTMVLRHYGLELMPGNNLYLQGSNHLEYKGQSIENDASSPYDTKLNITNPTADRTILLPDAAGTVALTDSATAFTAGATTVNGALTVNSDLLEITSTVDNATEKPIISLYRDAGVPSANDELGGIRWFGQNASDEKQFYGGIYAQADVITDGAHRGSLNFHLADGSNNGTAISDVLADINGDEDPTMSLTSELLTVNAGLAVSEGMTVGGGLTSSPTMQLITSATTNVVNSTFLSYAGKRIMVTTTNALTMDLPDSVAEDEGKTWVIMNASDNEITLDADNNGTAQYFRLLTGGAVITANQGFGGVEHIKITKGGIAELVCLGAGNSLTAPSYLIFGSGVHYE